MLKAVIFDFNGIIADDEPIHFELFAKVMAEERVIISRDEYNLLYLHLNDRDAFKTALEKHEKGNTPELISNLIRRKSTYYNRLISGRDLLFPDAAEFIRKTFHHYPLAIASGALNEEIEIILKQAGLFDCFPVIIGAERAVQGKPHPECYLKALSGLNIHFKRNPPITPSEVLVIEDSIGGIEGAHRAGMSCLAVTNSYSKDDLLEADFVVDSLHEIDFKTIQNRLEK
jgi:beta-phosphoglucomutase